MKIAALLLAAILVPGCASYNYREVATGPKSIWCNERYLPEIDARDAVTDDLHLRVAKQGYLYAFLSAYVLQSDSKESDEHHFALPSNIKNVGSLSRLDKSTGFEAKTFEVNRGEEKDPEIVVAFVGSNDAADWRANFSFNDKRQYVQARQYVLDVAKIYPGRTISVSGYSLGGALASHVTKNKQTSPYVKVAWVFNPSPKTWEDGEPDKRIWQASTTSDVLKVARWPLFRILPGVSYVGAAIDQQAENYYLIESNPVYAHFRWALARNILHTADLAYYKEGVTEEQSEPLKLLKASTFSACRAGS